MPKPETYTHGHHQSVIRSHAVRTARDSAAYLLPHLRPGMSVLDVGCGPGTITLDLARAVAPGRVVGLENVPEPLVTARANATDREDSTTRFVLGDIYQLPCATRSFDVVHAHQVLQHLGDPVAALREMARVCRPAGLVAVRDADYGAMAWYPPSDGLTMWRDVYRRLARANGAEPDAGRRLRSWARAAGLHDVAVSTSTWVYANPAATSWWGQTWSARARESSFAAQACERGLLDEAGIAAIAAAWESWGADPDAWFVSVHTEILATP